MFQIMMLLTRMLKSPLIKIHYLMTTTSNQHLMIPAKIHHPITPKWASQSSPNKCIVITKKISAISLALQKNVLNR